ncbi:MAG TPA: aminotransferase class III-fold pyridoxal phosphate-dependent enzyme [Steroidobacteraceae bacterium]|nr:aminotransferase class III-fold pyridoxal phosphate-dependent enzyme [Steroidobacteraceae bacterium]
MTAERETVLHSWCRQADWAAPTIVGGAGARIHTEDGRSILDMSSLAECNGLGHQHPRIVAAIKEQAEQLCFVTSAWGAQPRARLAELLLEKSGFAGGRVFFTLAGADANENAVKIARQASRKPRGKIIARDRSYHGASYATMALSGDTRTSHQVDAQAFGVVRALPPYAYRCPFDSTSAEQCGERSAAHIGELIDTHGAAQVAGVLMEPNAGTNGIVAPENYWPLLRATTREREVYLIADEVMSGFGRCGEWFAWQRYGEDGRPDLLTLAKGLTGAHLPLGAVVMSREIARKLENEMLYTGLTYCGHPLSCAAGVAAIEAYEDEGLIERSRRLGAQLLGELQKLQQRHAIVGDVRGGHGLFAVVELVRDRASKAPLSAWPDAHPALVRLVKDALARNVSFATRGNLIILAPPLVIEEKELQDALSLLDALLSEMKP